MMFVRLDCMIRLNPKIATLRSTTCWYFVCCLSYANQYETGGYVPKHAMPSLWSSMLEPRFQFRVHTDALTRAGILIDAGTAYRIHDYFDYQISLEQAQKRRLSDRARQQRHREKVRAEKTSEARWHHQGPSREETGEQGQGPCPPIGAGEAAPLLRSHDFGQASTRTSYAKSTYQVQELQSQVLENKRETKAGHGVTTHAVTHQSREETYRSRSDCLWQSESHSTLGESADHANTQALKAFAQKAGWGALPNGILARFCDLDPFPGHIELTLVQETLQRQVITLKRDIKSPAAYALRILHNRRKQKTPGATQTRGNAGSQGPQSSRHSETIEVRDKKLELYQQVADALGDNSWVASMTTGTIDELWKRGARDTIVICEAVDLVDAIDKSSQYKADWGCVFRHLDKASQAGHS